MTFGYKPDEDDRPDEIFEGKSRSCKKRESTALQKRGEELAALGPGIWKSLPVPPLLADALSALRGMKSHEAKRRQIQYVGRLMREENEEAINALLAALDRIQAESRAGADFSRRIESLRDALLGPDREARGNALQNLLDEAPALNEGRLRHLVEAALAEKEKQRPPRHSRELFRYLRKILDSA